MKSLREINLLSSATSGNTDATYQKTRINKYLFILYAFVYGNMVTTTFAAERTLNLLGKSVQRCRSLPSVALDRSWIIRTSPKTHVMSCYCAHALLRVGGDAEKAGDEVWFFYVKKTFHGK